MTVDTVPDGMVALWDALGPGVAYGRALMLTIERFTALRAVGLAAGCVHESSADFDAVAVSVDGAAVRLTRREFELLRYLVQNKNRVVSRDRLLERVWGYERLVETRSVDVHVGRLRHKLRGAGRQIETVVGLGYRFVD